MKLKLLPAGAFGHAFWPQAKAYGAPLFSLLLGIYLRRRLRQTANYPAGKQAGTLGRCPLQHGRSGIAGSGLNHLPHRIDAAPALRPDTMVEIDLGATRRTGIDSFTHLATIQVVTDANDHGDFDPDTEPTYLRATCNWNNAGPANDCQSQTSANPIDAAVRKAALRCDCVEFATGITAAL